MLDSASCYSVVAYLQPVFLLQSN